MTELGESLVERGVVVTALAGRGRYNGGVTLPVREIYRGVHIERAWATSFGKGSMMTRLCDYVSFYLGATWKLLTMPRHDIVMALTTPPLISLLALLVCRVRRMKLIALVQDVYPDVAVALGALNPTGLITKLLNHLNNLVLKCANRIIVLGDCMRERVTEKAREGSEQRIDVIHNWADGEKIRPLDESALNPFVEEHGLEGQFVLLFSGNFGLVNDFATVLDAARILSDQSGIKFLFIGDGAKKGEIEAYVKEHRLSNIKLLPYQPRELLPYSLAAGHVHLVTLAEGLAGLSVPSKTYGILAVGRPLIFVGDPRSDIARIVKETGCGEVVATGEGERLSRLILDYAENPERLKLLGLEARELFKCRFDRQQAVHLYLESFLRCMNHVSTGYEKSNPSTSPAEFRN